ncbi:MAG: hypothetical protein CMJ38_01450 [Phycisphaerae bacterium]|nr:hypothetical protein [Phycisphaerae bacterium]
MMSNTDQHHGDEIGHVIPIKFLVFICCILLFMTGVTVWVSWFDFTEIDMVEMGIIVAMAVASVKATLVGLYFMHLRWDRPFVGFIFVVSIILVLLMCGLTFLDTSAYQEDIIPGDTPLVTEALDKLKSDY